MVRQIKSIIRGLRAVKSLNSLHLQFEKYMPFRY